MIELRELTEENLSECLDLSVADNQKSFVAPNILSLAEAYVCRDTVHAFALYAEETMAGFTLLGEEKGTFWIIRLMIGRQFQRRGYGREAMKEIMDYLRKRGAEKGIATVKLSFEPENEAAQKLYHSFGFAGTGEVEDGELVMSRAL